MQKHFDKGKKDIRRYDDRDVRTEEQRKKKLKPVEKSKYRVKDRFEVEEDSDG